MFQQFRQLFNRYCSRHLKISLPGFPFMDEAGEVIGHLDRVQLADGRITFEGWTRSARVAITLDKQRRVVVPTLPRTDVTDFYGWDEEETPGFVLQASYAGQNSATISFEHRDARYVYVLPSINMSRARLGRLKLAAPFLGTVLRVIPDLARWKLRRDPFARAALKKAFGFRDEVSGLAANADLFLSPDRPAPRNTPDLMDTAITIVLPVYNAFDLLKEVLDRILDHTDLPWHLIIIEDCSTDPQVRPFLTDYVAAAESDELGRITLINNQINKGFIHSVNAGLELALGMGNHVVLLNSDAFVPVGWASRLIRPILAHDKVASVTPMSNDAEIFNVPVICERNALASGQADRIDALAQQFHPDADLAVSPTGVGFCMAINVQFLKQVPQLDSMFGRGYGEEVDWCQKVRRFGGRHIGLPGLYVEHRGGMSFGSVEKLKLVRSNNAIISKRYPFYDSEVQTFIRQDPLATPRLALAIAWAAENQNGAMSLYLAHALGGGAENYLRRRIADEIEDGKSAIVLRVGHDEEWRLELHTSMGITKTNTNDFAFIQKLLEPVEHRRIVYSNGVGHKDPVTLPARLLSLRRTDEDQIEVLIHDFFPLSPSYTLLNAKGAFVGVPASDDLDPAHQSRNKEGQRVSLQKWRAAWKSLLGAAEEVTVFSESSRKLVLDAYPDVSDRIVVRPHQLLIDAVALACEPKDTGEVVVGVLGNIGYQKGAAVLRDMSRDLSRSGVARLVVIGNVDPTYPLVAPAKIHGDYKVEDIPTLVSRYGITCWLIPSIWPETFSYTTHEALATGLPVWCFDLGAPAEIIASRAAQSGQGGLIPLPQGQASIPDIFQRLTPQKALA